MSSKRPRDKMHPRLKDKAWDDPPAKKRMFLADIHVLYNFIQQILM